MCSLPLQALAVPLAQISRCVVRALEEIHKRVLRRWRRSHIVIHQQELFQLRVVESRLQPNALFTKAGRLRRGIRVKRWSLNIPATGPEPGATHFVRVSLARDAIRTGTLRRRPPRETSDRKIETPTEKMHRAGLPLESGAELLEYLIDPYQNAPEFMRSFGIICRVNIIFLERGGIGNLTRRRPYAHTYAQFAQRRHKFFVKVGHAL